MTCSDQRTCFDNSNYCDVFFFLESAQALSMQPAATGRPAVGFYDCRDAQLQPYEAAWRDCLQCTKHVSGALQNIGPIMQDMHMPHAKWLFSLL